MKYNKAYSIILIKNGEVIPQTGLDYNSKEKAQEVANYLNSLLPENLKDCEYYSAVSKTKLISAIEDSDL